MESKVASYQDFFMEKIDNYLGQLKKEPNNIDLLMELGKIYHHCFDKKNSKKYLKKALTINPELYEAYYYLGYKDFNNLYFPNLYKSIELAKKNNDSNFVNMVLKTISDYYENLGWEYLDSPKYDKAKHYFEKAIENSPDHTDAYNGLGNYYYNKKQDYSKAKEYYQKAFEISKNIEDMVNTLDWYDHGNRPYMRSLIGLGLCNFLLGSRIFKPELLNESLAIFKKMLKLNPNDNQGVRYLIPDVYHKIGNYERAIKEYSTIIKTEGTEWNDDLCYNLALAYYKMSNTQNAEKWFREGIKHNIFKAIFILAQANIINFDSEIINIFGEFDTENFWKMHWSKYNAAYDYTKWSWRSLWVDAEDIHSMLKEVSERTNFLRKIYLNELKLRKKVIEFPKKRRKTSD